MFSDIQLGYIKLGQICGLSLRFNPYVLYAINMGSIDETILTIAHSVYRTIRFPHYKINANIFEINYIHFI